MCSAAPRLGLEGLLETASAHRRIGRIDQYAAMARGRALLGLLAIFALVAAPALAEVEVRRI